MNFQESFKFWILMVIVVVPAGAQVRYPIPTSPEITRYHFSYNHTPPANILENEDILVTIYVDEIFPG
ncbi:hypothetical protein K8T06_08010, partial [bacterium]|nr:hypothetical protein [bacterium]